MKTPWIYWSKKHKAIATSTDAPVFFHYLAMFIAYTIALFEAFRYWVQGYDITNIGLNIKMEEDDPDDE